MPWWPADRQDAPLHRILVHMIAETHRHAGHADIVRELIYGATGLQEGNDNMAPSTRHGGRTTVTESSMRPEKPAMSDP